MASVTQLGYIGLEVSRLDAWESFAQEILGLQVWDRNADGSLSLRLDEREQRIVLHPGPADDVAYLGLEVADEEALRALCATLKDSGVETTPGTPEEIAARRVAGLATCKDPSGVRVELHYGAMLRVRESFQSPLPIEGFVAGDQGLGHIVLHVFDFDQSMRFYRDLLGFRISDYAYVSPAPGLDIRVAFLHCNPRHHTIAFAAAPLPKRLNHLMVEMRALDDVGRAYQRVQDRGVPIAMTLGRHDNDRMLSFYMVSPSGFQVECGWGARQVDDADWRVETYRGGSLWGHRTPS